MKTEGTTGSDHHSTSGCWEKSKPYCISLNMALGWLTGSSFLNLTSMDNWHSLFDIPLGIQTDWDIVHISEQQPEIPSDLANSKNLSGISFAARVFEESTKALVGFALLINANLPYYSCIGLRCLWTGKKHQFLCEELIWKKSRILCDVYGSVNRPVVLIDTSRAMIRPPSRSLQK